MNMKYEVAYELEKKILTKEKEINAAIYFDLIDGDNSFYCYNILLR